MNGESLPAISISASRNEEEKVHVSLVNIDSRKTNKVTINLEELDVDEMTASILTSEALQNHNTFDAPDNIAPVAFEDFQLKEGQLQVELPPFSVVVLGEK